MRIAIGFALAGLALSLLFIQVANTQADIDEASDPTDLLDRAIAGLPPPDQPWYLENPVLLVGGTVLVAFVIGLLVAMVKNTER